MKIVLRISFVLIAFIALSSFTYATNNLQNDSIAKKQESLKAEDVVTITYDQSDVSDLEYLGKIEITEKWWFYSNDDIKEKTLRELKNQTSEKGGDIVLVDINETKGFGFLFSSTISGYVYKK